MMMDTTGRDTAADSNWSQRQFDAAEEPTETLVLEETQGAVEYVLFDNCILRF